MRTRSLLTCAAFGAVGALVSVLLMPLTGVLAVASPPAYALVAALYGLMPLAARRYLGITGAATLTALVSGLLVAAVSPLGLLSLAAIVLSALTTDATLWLAERARRRGALPGWLFVAAALPAGVVLFVVSLPVFSAEHLQAWILLGAALGRLVGQAGVAAVAVGLIDLLARAGVRPRSRGSAGADSAGAAARR